MLTLKKSIIFLSFTILIFSAIAMPKFALAHSHYTFQIGNKTYQFIVGSINEPLIVDDKSGLDLTVTEGGGMPTMGPDGDMDGPLSNGTPVNGLEKTLKVEMSAGSQKKTMDLRPAYGKPGGYTTIFYPTVKTIFSYRLFGTINNVPVDLSFACNPAGHSKTVDDKNVVKISDTVTQTMKSGAFGCAEAKTDFGFPEKSASIYEIQQKAGGLNVFISLSIILGLIGAIAGIRALIKFRKK